MTLGALPGVSCKCRVHWMHHGVVTALLSLLLNAKKTQTAQNQFSTMSCLMRACWPNVLMQLQQFELSYLQEVTCATSCRPKPRLSQLILTFGLRRKSAGLLSNYREQSKGCVLHAAGSAGCTRHTKVCCCVNVRQNLHTSRTTMINVCPATHVVAAACARHTRGLLLLLHKRVQ